MMKKMIALVLALVMCMALVACGGEPDPNCGTWNATKVVAAGQSFLPADIDVECSMILEDGGNGSMTINGEGGGIEWTNNEGTLRIVDEAGMEVTATVTGNELVFVDFGGYGFDLYMEKAQ